MNQQEVFEIGSNEPGPAGTKPPAIRTHELTRRYGRLVAVDALASTATSRP